MKATIFILSWLLLATVCQAQDYIIIRNDGYTQRMTADDMEYEQRRIIRQELERADQEREDRRQDEQSRREFDRMMRRTDPFSGEIESTEGVER